MRGTNSSQSLETVLVPFPVYQLLARQTFGRDDGGVRRPANREAGWDPAPNREAGSRPAPNSAQSLEPETVLARGSIPLVVELADHLLPVEDPGASVRQAPMLAESKRSLEMSRNLPKARLRGLVLISLAWIGATSRPAFAGLVGPGDLAFIGFNADGDDDFSIVLLADATAGTLIRFNDNEWQGSAFNTGEGSATWNVTESLAAGTVVTFSNVDNTGNSGFGPSRGTLSNALQFAVGSETLYAFVGSNASTPTSFLAAISTSTSDFNGPQGTLAGTGLVQGTTAVLLPTGTRGGQYSGKRDGQSAWSGYLPLIGNTGSEWIKNSTNGENVLPFNTTPFSTPEPATWSLSLAALFGVGTWLRRRITGLWRNSLFFCANRRRCRSATRMGVADDCAAHCLVANNLVDVLHV